MKTILVSGASGIVGYGILRSLQSINKEYNLIGTSIYQNSPAPLFCDIFIKAVNTKDNSYIEWLCNVIIKYKVNMIIPGIEEDMYKWSDNREVLEQTGAFLLLNNKDLLKLCYDKWEFYNNLSINYPDIAIPTTINGTFEQIVKEYKLPFLLKPRKGYGSKGIIKVDSKMKFEENKESFGEILMAQPVIGSENEEFTVSAFFDNNNDLCCFICLKRKLSNEGFTSYAKTVDIDGIEEILVQLARIFKPIGPTNLQFRNLEGQLKLLEINPRISSATSIRTAFGYNESEISINYFLNKIKPKQPKIKYATAIRYIEEMIVDDRSYF